MKITVVGAGRIGLCFALSLEEFGNEVSVVDINEKTVATINEKKLPFKEEEYESLMKKTKITAHLLNKHDYPVNSDVYIFTVNTPLAEHIETDLSHIESALSVFIDNVDIRDKLIIFRSTLAPGTMEFIKGKIYRETEYVVGKDYSLVFSPERVSENHIYKELFSLPQIIGCEDDLSFDRASELFSLFKIDIFKASFIEAELSKIFCNVYRYINFAIPNWFTVVSNQFGADYGKISKMIKHKYERNKGLAGPGFAAGTCLRKDFGMINEYMPYADLALNSYKINEYMPVFYANLIKNSIEGRNVGILGYTMKADCDDTRDSLVPKLIRYIERNNPHGLKINEPNIHSGGFYDIHNDFYFFNEDEKTVVENSEIIYIANRHKEYLRYNESMFEGKIVIDIWNILGKELILDLRK